MCSDLQRNFGGAVAHQRPAARARTGSGDLARLAGGEDVSGELPDLFVRDPLLAVGEHGEAGVDLVEVLFPEIEPEIRAARLQRVTPAVLAQHQPALRHADALRLDD